MNYTTTHQNAKAKVLFLYCRSTFKPELSLIHQFGQVDKSKYESYAQERKQKLLNGRYLLSKGLEMLGSDLQLNQLSYTYRMKPFFEVETDIQFNISHSNDMIICAITKDNIKLGVDVEFKEEKTIKRISTFFTPEEESYIQNDYQLILEYWTQKEAILKACNSHIFNMKNIDCTMNPIHCFDEYWWDTIVKCDENYITRVMTNKPVATAVIEIN